MLLITRRAGYARHDSEYRAESIIRAIDRIGYPTAAASMPSFAL